MSRPSAIKRPARRLRRSTSSCGTLLPLLPESRVLQVGYVVDDIVAIIRHARKLVGIRLPEHIRSFMVLGSLEVRAGAGVTMQALAVVIRLVEPDVLGLRNGAEILEQHVPDVADFRFDGAAYRVIGVVG